MKQVSRITAFGSAVLLTAAGAIWTAACSPGGTATAASEGGNGKAAQEESKKKDTDSGESLPPVKTVEVKDVAKLLEKHQGKAVVLNFWATWCPPCVAEMPELVEFYEKTDRKDVAFISLSADAKSTIDSHVKPFQKEKDLPFPIYVLDTRNPDALTEVLQVELSGALPTTLVYDRNGELEHVWEQAITLEDLHKVVDPLV